VVVPSAIFKPMFVAPSGTVGEQRVALSAPARSCAELQNAVPPDHTRPSVGGNEMDRHAV
jgi:hypothetical protein